MEEIIEIVYFLSKKKIRQIETLNIDDTNDSVYREFYYLILNNPYITEDEIAQKIAGTTKSSKKYGMLKSRFKKRLLNHTLFLDLSENSSKQAIEISNAYKNIYSASLYRGNNLLKTSYYIIDRTLKTIEKYELLDLLVIAYQIKLNESSVKNQPKKLEEYSQKLIFCTKAFSHYTRSLIIYEKVGLIFSKSDVVNSKDLKKLENIIRESNELLKEKELTFNIQWNIYSVLLEYYEYIGDYAALLKKVKEMEKIFSQTPIFFYTSRKLLLYTWKLEALGNLKITQNTETLINQLQNFYDASHMGWFLVQRRVLFYYINTEQYNLAIKIATEVVSANEFLKIQPKLQEMWLLWHTFLQILDADYDTDKLKEIKIHKVLNSVPQISKDKLGLNTLVRTLEILYGYLTYDDDNLIKMYNALLIYKTRYLKPNKLRRSQIFFDMLTASSTGGYTNDAVKQKGAKALKRLERLKNDNPERKAYEFIPYEKLIEIMMERR